MLGFAKGSKGTLLAVCDGEVFGVESVPDEVFSQKILGDGFAQKPDNGTIRAPSEGVIAEVAESKHAYCIEGADGAQILVHIGIDTVQLKGEGFEPKVKKGDKVRAGAVIAEVDLDLIKNKGYDSSVITLITNTEKAKSIRAETGAAQGGVSVVLRYKIS